MSAGREVNAEKLSAREEAVRAAEDHWPDATKRHILITLARLIRDDDCLIWPSVAWMAWRTGLGETSIETAFAEFRRHGILQPTGDTIGQGGTLVYRFDTERLVGAYPLHAPWEEIEMRNKTKRQSRKKPSANVPRVPGNVVNANAFNVPHVAGNDTAANGATFPAGGVNVPRLAGQRSPFGGSTFPAEPPNVPRVAGTRVLGFTEGLKQGSEGRSVAAQASPLSRTDCPAAEPENASQKNCGVEVIAKALADAFYNAHGEATVHNHVADDCLRLATTGASVDDMRKAIATVKHKAKSPGGNPRWTAVHHVLDGVLRTRETVVNGLSHKCSAEALHAAQRLEAIYARYFNKPAWNAASSRWHMGEWLCRCVSWHRVDEALFESSCRDARNCAKGKPPTWRQVKAALDARIEARSRDAQQSVPKDKPFFDRPTAPVGKCVVPGNDTRH